MNNQCRVCLLAAQHIRNNVSQLFLDNSPGPLWCCRALGFVARPVPQLPIAIIGAYLGPNCQCNCISLSDSSGSEHTTGNRSPNFTWTHPALFPLTSHERRHCPSIIDAVSKSHEKGHLRRRRSRPRGGLGVAPPPHSPKVSDDSELCPLR